MRRIRIELAYDGTAYHGWQVQPDLPTIQAELERVVGQIEGAPVAVDGSGRTDAGVHALAQVAAFSLTNPIPEDNLCRAMNRLLPPDIRILRVQETNAAFHPRFDALGKTYEYRIFRGQICSPFERRYVYHHPYPLNAEAIVELAPVFEGEHDFSAFAASDEKDRLGASKVRRVFSSRIELENDRILYRVSGNGFLKHMVRNLVGVLLEAGRGNIGREEVLARLRPGSTSRPGRTAPACGLFLVSVRYPDHPGSHNR